MLVVLLHNGGGACIRALGGNEDGTVTYDRFRRFALLLPEEQITVMDPGRAWFEAASMMPLGAIHDLVRQDDSANLLAAATKQAHDQTCHHTHLRAACFGMSAQGGPLISGPACQSVR